jgi:hypothetical protein
MLRLGGHIDPSNSGPSTLVSVPTFKISSHSNILRAGAWKHRSACISGFFRCLWSQPFLAVGPELVLPSEWLPLIWMRRPVHTLGSIEARPVLGGLHHHYVRI